MITSVQPDRLTDAAIVAEAARVYIAVQGTSPHLDKFVAASPEFQAAIRRAVALARQPQTDEPEDCGHPWRIEPSAFAAGVRTCNTCGM